MVGGIQHLEKNEHIVSNMCSTEFFFQIRSTKRLKEDLAYQMINSIITIYSIDNIFQYLP